MRHRRDHRGLHPILGFNATPLVDVIFLLTIFFMLVSRFSSAERVTMDLPDPRKSQARAAEIPERVVINCRLAEPADADTHTVVYSIGPNRPEPLSVISERLETLKRQSPSFEVIVRADRRLRYVDVRRVMHVIARNDLEVLNVAAHVGEVE